MGSFANSIFNLLLGWVRTAASSLWRVLNGSGEDIVSWLSENWLGLAIAICVVCTVIDMLVHLIRWRPYKVWASFFRRITGREARMEQAEEPVLQPEPEREPQRPVVQEWVYPDGKVQQAETPAQVPQTTEEVEAYRSRFARPTQQISYRRPPEMERLQYQKLPVEQPAPVQPEPVQEAAAEPTQQFGADMLADEQQRESLSNQMRRRITQLQKNLGITEEDEAIAYRPAQPIVDEKEMYHEPVYPPDWNQQETMRVTPRRRRQHREINSDD